MKLIANEVERFDSATEQALYSVASMRFLLSVTRLDPGPQNDSTNTNVRSAPIGSNDHVSAE